MMGVIAGRPVSDQERPLYAPLRIEDEHNARRSADATQIFYWCACGIAACMVIGAAAVISYRALGLLAVAVSAL